MKIVFNRQSVIAALSPLMCATSNKSTLTAAEGILIEAVAPDACTLTAYDLEKGMRTTVTATVLEEGSYIINAQKLMQTMRVMDGEELTLEVDSKLTTVFTSGRSSHKMLALKSDQFPVLPNLESEKGFTIKQGVLKSMLYKTMHAMGVNDPRPTLNGCYFRVEYDKLLTVSCDSFRLARCQVTAEMENQNKDGSDLRFKFILPNKTVAELFKLLSDDEEETVRIHMMRKHIVFYFDNLIFFSRLIDGEYIDFDRIIIQNHRMHVTVEKNSLLSALECASLVTEEKVANSGRSHVKLEIDGPLMKVLASSSAGSTYDEMEIENLEGGSIVIGFKNRYLMDSLKACDSERVKIELSTLKSAINIIPLTEDEGKSDLFMLLPVLMKD